MIRTLSIAALALLLAAPFATPASAQAQMALRMRLDESTSASDPDDTPDVKVLPAANGFEVQTGPAAVLWDPSNTASGNYTLRGTFRLQEPSSHTNYYGLVLGGRDLDGANQNYVYYLIGQNGTFIVKHRMGDMVHDIVGRTPHEAVRAMDDNGQSTNQLEVRVGAQNVEFVANGTVIHSVARSNLAGATDGIWGVRINHVLPSVVVEGLGVTQ